MIKAGWIEAGCLSLALAAVAGAADAGVVVSARSSSVSVSSARVSASAARVSSVSAARMSSISAARAASVSRTVTAVKVSGVSAAARAATAKAGFVSAAGHSLAGETHAAAAQRSVTASYRPNREFSGTEIGAGGRGGGNGFGGGSGNGGYRRGGFGASYRAAGATRAVYHDNTVLYYLLLQPHYHPARRDDSSLPAGSKAGVTATAHSDSISPACAVSRLKSDSDYASLTTAELEKIAGAPDAHVARLLGPCHK